MYTTVRRLLQLTPLLLATACGGEPESAPAGPAVGPPTGPTEDLGAAEGPPPFPNDGPTEDLYAAEGPPPFPNEGPGADAGGPPHQGGLGDLPPAAPAGGGELVNPILQVVPEYYQGLVLLERGLREGSEETVRAAEARLLLALEIAARREDLSVERALGKTSVGGGAPGYYPYRLVGTLMYLAWVREHLGDASLRERAVRSNMIDFDAYAFHFETRDVDEVIRFELLNACFSLGEHVQGTLERWRGEHDGLYPETLAALVPEYLAKVPSCPADETSFEELYQRLDDGRDFELVCHGHQAINGFPVCVGARCQAAVNPDLEQTFKIYPMLLGSFLDRDRLDLFLPLLLERAKLEPGQVVADIGAGAGLFSIPFAEAVGPEGKVYAVDINASVLAFVKARSESREGTRIETVLSVRPDVTLPEASVDVAFIIQTYHAMIDLDRPADPGVWKVKTGPWMQTVHAALEPGGLLIIQDGADKMDPEVVVANLENIGFERIELVRGWDWQYIAVLRRE